MDGEKFALLMVRLMSLSQIAPQAPAPTSARPLVQTSAKGPKEAEYNSRFNLALRITGNPIFQGRTREEIAGMCLDAGMVAGQMTTQYNSGNGSGGAGGENEGCVFDGDIEANESMFD